MAKIPQTPAQTPGASSPGAVAKEEANYRKGDPAGEACLACMNFRPEMEACQLVRGPISPGGLCDLFAAAEDGQTAPGTPGLPPDPAMLEEMLFGGGGGGPPGLPPGVR